MDKLEVAVGGVDFGYDAHMTNVFAHSTPVEEHEVAGLKVFFLHCFAIVDLRVRRASELIPEFSEDVACES